MLRLLFAWLVLILFSVISISSTTAEESRKKAPMKQRPAFPKQIQLPPPFNRWNSCDLAQRLYPDYNCNNGRIDEETSGSIANVSIWKDGKEEHLLALFEKFGISDKSEIAGGKIVDIALYDINNNQLKLTVSANEVISYRKDGSSYFDLAPYRLSSTETAVGVRVDPGITGSFGLEILYLFRVKDNIFQLIFTRDMIDIECYGDWGESSNILRRKSILQVISNRLGMNDFKIVSRYFRFNDSGDDDLSKIIKTTSELWRWNESRQKYELSN